MPTTSIGTPAAHHFLSPANSQTLWGRGRQKKGTAHSVSPGISGTQTKERLRPQVRIPRGCHKPASRKEAWWESLKDPKRQGISNVASPPGPSLRSVLQVNFHPTRVTGYYIEFPP